MQELLNTMFEYKSRELYTALPAIVVKVNDNLESMSVDVQPTLNVRQEDGDITQRPAILNVPVQMPSSNTSAFTFPVNIGDTVLLIFSMEGIDTWKRGNGRATTPSDLRHHSMRDCFAITGVFPSGNSVNSPSKRTWNHNTKDTVIVHNIGSGRETEVRLGASGGIVINTNQDVVTNCKNATVNATSVNVNSTTMQVDVANTTWSGNMNYTGSITHNGTFNNSGTVRSNGITLSGHTHDNGKVPPPDSGT